MSSHVSGALTPSSQHLVEAAWPVVVAEVGRDKKISPVLVGQPEHSLTPANRRLS